MARCARPRSGQVSGVPQRWGPWRRCRAPRAPHRQARGTAGGWGARGGTDAGGGSLGGPLLPLPARGVVTACASADYYDLDRVVSAAAEHRGLRLLWSWPPPPTTRHAVHREAQLAVVALACVAAPFGSGQRCALVFREGCLVTWGPPPEAGERCALTETLAPAEVHADLAAPPGGILGPRTLARLRGLYARPSVEGVACARHGSTDLVETMDYTTAAAAEPAVAPDEDLFLIPAPGASLADQLPQLLPGSYALAQSVKIDAFARQSDPLRQQLKEWQRALLSRHSFPSAGQLLAMRAHVRLIRNDAASGACSETPRIFWSDQAQLCTRYEQCRDHLEVRDRAEVLSGRLGAAADDAAFLAEEMHTAHGHRLELIIIYLIMVEVAIALLNIAFGGFPQPH
eukprot:TRINITY_DN21385_c0_g1_i2.p1 TRINITY_DN21385_c0_g1~~TRINITY_DN21385_c0_g1_i2.p1  ORF type:complete len:400 (+),score=86.50 TRINITY_DN21385_c0_g1_i2:117-1316(+)